MEVHVHHLLMIPFALALFLLRPSAASAVGEVLPFVSFAQKRAVAYSGDEADETTLASGTTSPIWRQGEDFGYPVYTKEAEDEGRPDSKQLETLTQNEESKISLVQFAKLHGPVPVMPEHTEMFSHTGEGDWVFAMHHKSGTTVAMLMALDMCNKSGRAILRYSAREKRPACKRCCHILIKLDTEDLDDWLQHVESHPSSRLIHFVRDPVEMVASGYRYHWRGSEPEWTNNESCSRDLCSLPEPITQGLSKKELNEMYIKMSAKPWLESIGCYGFKTYGECLRANPTNAGLYIEAKRAYPALMSMISITERTSSSNQVMSLCSDGLKPDQFNSTVSGIVQWLGIDKKSQRQYAISAYAKVFFGDRSEKLIYSHSTSLGVVTHGYDDYGRPMQLLDTRPLQEAIESWQQGHTCLRLKELRARSSCANVMMPSVFAEGQQLMQIGDRNVLSRGIVMCSKANVASSTAQAIDRIRLAGSDLPIEIWHLSELNPAAAEHLQKQHRVVVRDLVPYLNIGNMPVELEWAREHMCEPLAVLASSFSEILMMRSDTRVFMNISSLFSTSVYKSFGMLLFRHRTDIGSDSMKTDAGHYLRQLIHRRLDVNSFFDNPSLDSKPWSPSVELLEADIVRGLSNRQIDEGLLLLDKERNKDMVSALHALHDRYRHELYSNLKGHGEVFWIACEFVGQCGISSLHSGVFGHAGQDGCLVGDSVQFHPEDPHKVIFCNCAADSLWHTHIGGSQANTSRDASLSTSSRHAFATNDRTAQRSTSKTQRQRAMIEFDIRVNPASQVCLLASKSEPVSQVFSRQGKLGETFDSSFCSSLGQLCKVPGTCSLSSSCSTRPW
eukprot:TRINITY_DN21917_c0_g1_i3.p1 TRINITY_DN21917_c0_g1~~TRINITY_DN21917_c0_g1_i3.p1  ORF type:complete len:841 (+),score=67.92 TRINITY_DN21917_c0_g1_i3:72-2594(+)